MPAGGERHGHDQRSIISTCAFTAPLTLKAELVELSRQIWDGGAVLAAAAQELEAVQQVAHHLVNDGGVGRRLPQLQHLGVQDAADPVPLWSCPGDEKEVLVHQFRTRSRTLEIETH